MFTRDRIGRAAPVIMAHVIIAAIAGPIISPALAQQTARTTCPGSIPSVAIIVTLDGNVRGADLAGGAIELALGEALCPGDRISTGDDGRAELRFEGRDTTVGLSRNSSIRLPAAADTGADLDMVSGVMRFISSVRGLFSVRTRHANAGIDGTEAVIAVDPVADASLVLVQEGDVTVTAAAGGTLALARGQAGFVSRTAPLALANAAQVPPSFRGLLADPAGATDWAIHFPPVLPANAPDAARQAAALLDAGDPDGAEALLAGRTEADALALRAVVAVLRNRRDEGTGLAEQAVAAGPGRVAPLMARSYALQAMGRVSAARRAAEAAVAAAPQDTNARARLGELLLTEGDRAGAVRAIRAIPETGHTAASRAVQGLASLAVDDYAAAQVAFDAGIALDSEAPLPRLGLGLLMIRRGELAAGRRELELAAALDPRRGATRTWLGRAYFDEGLADKAASQFDEARARDPDDPAPWVASAQQNFAANRPVEALGEIEAARARAAGRAVLRSASGLAEDHAMQGAAIGRIYDVLGFTDQAILAGAAATEADQTNPAAHFLLADVLGQRSGSGMARASSLLQAQAYDPPGKTPVQPQLSESDLGLLDTQGAARASFAEFSPFFDADGFRADATGLVGTQQTFSDELSFTALHRGVSIGIGQFHYETEGYRRNNKVNHDIVSLQARASVIPWLDLFGEFRHRDTEAGDRTLEFDLDDVTDPLSDADKRKVARLGFHAEIGGGQDVVGVYTYTDRDRTSDTVSVPFDIDTNSDQKGHDIQLQHTGSFGRLTTVSGLSYVTMDESGGTTFSLFGVPIFVEDLVRDFENFGAYGYGTYRLSGSGPLAGIELTGGLGLDVYDDGRAGGRDGTWLHPKLGVRARVAEGVVLRGAFTSTTRPEEIFEQRLEPVTVAGFAQYFDTPPGSVTRQLAGGTDLRLMQGLWAGTETSRRWVETRVAGDTVDLDVWEFRGYLNAAPGKRISVVLEAAHEDTDLPDVAEGSSNFELTEIAAGASYFHPLGFFASGRIGWAWTEFDSIGVGFSGKDNFPISELNLGYRLPDERGVLSLEIQNLLDDSFGFADPLATTVDGAAAPPRFARDLTVLGRLTLSF